MSTASSLELGYRRPLRPTEKDGVVLQLGNFIILNIESYSNNYSYVHN